MGMLSAAVHEEKKRLVRKLFEKGVELVNREVDLDEFKRTYFPDEDRTLCLNIAGLEDLDTGFVFESGKVRTIRKLVDTPTLGITLTEDTFLAICLGKLTFAEAYWYGYLTAEGRHMLRDVAVFQRVFDKYGKVLTARLRGGASA